MDELNKLEIYLQEHGYKYKRIDREEERSNWHQIIVNKGDVQAWDAICHTGSLGYELGLLEIMGSIVEATDDSVEGYLKADDIIERLELDNTTVQEVELGNIFQKGMII